MPTSSPETLDPPPASASQPQPAGSDPRCKRATRNSDHARRRHSPAPSDVEIEARLNDRVKPAVFAELDRYRHLGLRNRLLTLPVMVSVVLVML